MAAKDFLSEINNINIINRTFLNKKAIKTTDVKSVTDLISEVYRVLGKEKTLKDQIAKILFSELPKIELQIKELLLNNLNSFISCSYNQIIPDSLIDDGINIEHKNLDYKGILKNNPNSAVGQLNYYDVASGLNTTDLNTFLWNVINTNPNTQNWKNVLNITYTPIDIINKKTNTFNVKIPESYRGKRLKDYNKDFIAALDIYDEKALLTNLFDSSFGVINKSSKTQQELAIEQEIDNLVDGIINSADDIESNDEDLYGFSSAKYDEQIKQTTKLKFNLLNLNGDKQQVNADFEGTSSFIISTTSSSNTKQKIDNFSSYVDKLQTSKPSDFDSEGTNKSTKIKTNVVKSILDKLLLVISNVMVSPKVVLILYINSYATQGKEEFEKGGNNTIKGVIKTLKGNIYGTIKGIASNIIKYFVKDLEKQIFTSVVEPTIKRKMMDKLNMRKAQLLSLTGVDLSGFSASAPKLGTSTDGNGAVASTSGNSSVGQQAIDAANVAVNTSNQANSTANNALTIANQALTIANSKINTIYVDGVTITGTGLTPSNPLVAVVPDIGDYVEQITLTGTQLNVFNNDNTVDHLQLPSTDLTPVWNEIYNITGDIQNIEQDIITISGDVQNIENIISGFTGATGYYKQQFTNTTGVTVNHNFGSYPVVDVIDENGVEFIPQSITHTTEDSVQLTFNSNKSGFVICSLGGGVGDEYVKSVTLTGSEINVFNGDNTVDHLQLPSGFTGVTTDITLTGNGFDVDLGVDLSVILFEHRYISDTTYSYMGTAPYGSPDSDPVWSITRMLVNNNGTVSLSYASNVAWEDYLTIIYV